MKHQEKMQQDGKALASDFFYLAVRSSSCPNSAQGIPLERARITVMGGVSDSTNNRESFIQEGLEYVRRFGAIVGDAVLVLRERIECAGEEDERESLRESISIIQAWGTQAEHVDLDYLAVMLREDWDERALA